MHSPLASQSAKLSLSPCGTEHITAAEAALVDLSGSDLSCQSLSQTQQLIFLSTAVTAGVETAKRGRLTYTAQNSSIKQPYFASLVEFSCSAEGVLG